MAGHMPSKMLRSEMGWSYAGHRLWSCSGIQQLEAPRCPKMSQDVWSFEPSRDKNVLCYMVLFCRLPAKKLLIAWEVQHVSMFIYGLQVVWGKWPGIWNFHKPSRTDRSDSWIMLNIFYSRYPPFLSHIITSYHLWVRQIADWQKPAQSRFVGPRCHFSLTYLQQYPGRSHCKRWQWCIGIWRTCLKNCGELMQVVGCCRDCTSQLTSTYCWKMLKDVEGLGRNQGSTGADCWTCAEHGSTSAEQPGHSWKR